MAAAVAVAAVAAVAVVAVMVAGRQVGGPVGQATGASRVNVVARVTLVAEDWRVDSAHPAGWWVDLAHLEADSEHNSCRIRSRQGR